MKKIILLGIIYCSLLFSQDWNNEVTTTIYEPYFYTMDIFTNSSGHHILIWREQPGYNYILYYKLNSQGIVQGNPITFTNDGVYPTITGSNEKIYAFYKSGNITGKYSTDGGNSWSNLPGNLSVSNHISNIDAVWDSNGVHLVYGTHESGYWETYYYRLANNFEWVEGQNVTDTEEAPYGYFPSIALSEAGVHVSFVQVDSSGGVCTRDKSEGDWQDPQFVEPVTGISNDAKLVVSGDYLYIIYDLLNSTVSVYDLKYKFRCLTCTDWTGGDIHNGTGYGSFNVTKTYDGKLQLIYDFLSQYSAYIYHRSYDGENWSDEFTLEDSYDGKNGITSVSNDFFAFWKPDDDDYLHYRQYDDIPLIPPTFSGEVYQSHPKLTWLKIEPDIEYFEIWRRSTNQPEWSLLSTTSNTFFVDYSVVIGPQEAGQADYKARAKDYSDYYSDFTEQIIFYYQGIRKGNLGNKVLSYSLYQNYPNPFNPTTNITYALPEDSKVSIKIYDMLGNEVVELANGYKPAGRYETTFDASNFSSGIYIYRITALNGERILFSESKRMILMK